MYKLYTYIFLKELFHIYMFLIDIFSRALDRIMNSRDTLELCYL